MLDVLLGDIPILCFTEIPCPLLTKVAMLMMPLIDCIKEFLSRYNNASKLKYFRLVFCGLKPSQHLARCEVSRGPNLLNRVLVNVLVAILVLATKL